MSSAIEVLKYLVERNEGKHHWNLINFLQKNEIDALGEALLALEKQEKENQKVITELKEIVGRLDAHNRICLTNNPRECLKLELETIKKRLKELKKGGKK